MTNTPTKIIVAKNKKSVKLEFQNNKTKKFDAEILRVLSPSAEVQGHSEAERKLIAGKKNITITNIKPVGNYAIRIIFSDGHNTGLFSWNFLSELDKNYKKRSEQYLKELKDNNLTRE